MNIAFLIGSCGIGGGTYVIFQHALYLQNAGHKITIIHMQPKTSYNWHHALEKLNFLPLSNYHGEEYDILIATWWATVYHLSSIVAGQYIYFVQSIESWFYKNDDKLHRQLVEATYAAPLIVITETEWIKAHLEREYGRDCLLAPNGIRKDYLTPHGHAIDQRQPGKLRVLVEGPAGIDFKNVLRTIKLARDAGSDEIWWVTADDLSWYPGVNKVFSRVAASEIGAIYRSCDVLLKLSYVEGMFGPPLEMFHCGGTAIVYDVTGHDDYIRHNYNGIVVGIDNEKAVIAAIQKIKNDPVYLENLKKNALKTANHWPNWEQASSIFLQHIERIYQRESCDITLVDNVLHPYRMNYETPPKLTLSQHFINKLVNFVRAYPPLKRALAPFLYLLSAQFFWQSPLRKKNSSL